jgi:hypothetical protein
MQLTLDVVISEYIDFHRDLTFNGDASRRIATVLAMEKKDDSDVCKIGRSLRMYKS